MNIKSYKPRSQNKARRISRRFLYLFILVVIFVLVILPRKSKAPDTNLAVSSPMASLSAVEQETPLPDLAWPENQTILAKILMYHHVGPLPENADDIRKGLTVSVENFDSQLKYLKDNQYIVVTLKKLYEMVARGEDTSRVVVLTFDDGYSDNFDYAWNAMQKYAMQGTFFIISGKIGQNEYMDEDQIRALASGSNEIASHSVAHLNMDQLDADRARVELADSKKALESLSGQQIYSFCYPAGKYSDETKKLVGESGYKIAVTTQKGKSFSTDNPFEIPRYRINPGTNLKSLM